MATRQEIEFNWDRQSSDASQQAGGTASLGQSLDEIKRKTDRMKLIASIGNGFEVVISLPSTTLTIYNQLEPNGISNKTLNQTASSLIQRSRRNNDRFNAATAAG